MKLNKKLTIIFLLTILILGMHKIVFANTKKEINNAKKPLIITSRESSDGILDKIKHFVRSFGAALPSSYRTTGLTVKDQKTTGECWAFAYTSAIEAYNLKHSGNTDIYSPRHIDYSCSNSFTNAPAENVFNRSVTEAGGNYYLASAYALSGKGPVLETSMPFSEELNKINYNDLNKEVKKQVEGYKIFNSVYKKYSGSSVTYYYDAAYGNPISDIKSFRDSVKSHIQQYGGVLTTIYENSLTNKDVFVKDYNQNPNHAIFIVGWDDNYRGSGWNSVGAYIGLNSYSSSKFDNGYIYISYDDAYVEEQFFGITSVSDVDYSNVYEHDELGFIDALNGKRFLNSSSDSEITAVNIFTKTASKEERITEVAFGSASYQNVEVYYTDSFSDNNLPYNFRKIATKNGIEPGYTNINLNSPIDLKGKAKFAIAVRFIENNDENIATAAVETKSDLTKWWDNVASQEGESYFVVNQFNPLQGNTYYTVRNNYEKPYNAAIKVYTANSEVAEKEGTVKTSEYKVIDNIIAKVPLDTTVEQFKTKITVTGDYTITDSTGKPVTGKMKTGDKLVASGKTYLIAVVSDISGDGNGSILDLARIRAHIVQRKGFILTGANFYAADLSDNGNVDILDLARMRKVCTR